MNIQKLVLSLLVLLIFTVAPSLSWSKDRKAQIPLDDARMIIEFNSTDEDVGIQVFLDGEPWQKVSIVNPNGNKILDVFGRNRLSGLA